MSKVYGSLLIPGMASVGTVIFKPLVTELEKLGVEGFEGIDLPSIDPQTAPEPNGLEADVAAIRARLIEAVEDQGRDIVFVAHSYGATPALGAAVGLWKSTREKEGKKGGIVKAALIGGAISFTGESRAGSIGEFIQNGGKMDLPPPDLEETPMGLLIKTTGCREVFFHELPATEGEHWDSTLRRTCLSSLTSPLPAVDPKEWDIAFLECLKDRAMSSGYAAATNKRCIEAGAKLESDTIDTGHFSWLEKPEETAQWLKGVVEKAGSN